jgi:hypothetical protein
MALLYHLLWRSPDTACCMVHGLHCVVYPAHWSLLPTLVSRQAGVLPSADAVISIPSALVALCLNTNGLKRVRETAVLNVLIDMFTSKKIIKVLTSDTPAVLGSGLEELMR